MTKHTTLSQDYTYNKKTYKAGSRVVVHSEAGKYAKVTLFNERGGSIETMIEFKYLAL